MRIDAVGRTSRVCPGEPRASRRGRGRTPRVCRPSPTARRSRRSAPPCHGGSVCAAPWWWESTSSVGCRISAAEGDRTREGAEHGRHGAASRPSRWTMDLEDTRTSEPPRPACTPRAASGTPCLRRRATGCAPRRTRRRLFFAVVFFFVHSSASSDSSYRHTTVGTFRSTAPTAARHITRYLATFTPSLPPRASRPVSPPAPPSRPGRRA